MDKLLYATAILNGILNRVACKHYMCMYKHLSPRKITEREIAYDD